MMHLDDLRLGGFDDERDGRGGLGDGRGGFGRGGGGRGGGRRRMFDAGGLSLVLLHFMEVQPRHGYDLIREIEARTGGAYVPSPGLVYPTLTLLEEQGRIEVAASEGSKRLFSLTAMGLAHLEAERPRLAEALARLDAFRADGARVEAGPVWRAMENLKAVLRQRLDGPQDKQTLFDVADLIDDAARKIERL